MNGLFKEVAEFLKVDLSMFNNTQTTILAATGTNDLSYEMKTYYSDYLIDNAWPELVHDQFGQKRPIPKNGGKIIEFRKYSPLAKATTPLTEGTTPSGQALNVTVVTATIAQYGGYVELSDLLMMTAIDNNLVEATKLLGHQAGETLDTITRNVINAGTNVQYNDADVLSRYLLVGGETSGNHYFSVASVRRAVRNLKYNKAKKINGSYVAIIHPDVAYDLLGDDDWVSAAEYAGSTQIFEGEIGKIHGVRFVETTEAKIFHAEPLIAVGSTNAARNLTVRSYNAQVITVEEAISSAEALLLVGRYIIVDGYKYTIASSAAGAATAATITITESPSHDPANADVIYPGEAGAKGRDIYSTLIVGADAYGVTEISGGGLETIVKQLGSAGTADALNQRATVGWKATKVAEILVQTYMVRVESASTFNNNAAN
jgi:N4-gp56 family major capsid protein